MVNGILSPLMTVQSFNVLSKSQQKTQANIFGITVEEYKQYLDDMNNTIDGYEYQNNINPNFVLAMHTQDQSKYQEYLKNVVKEDHDAISRLIKVNNDYARMGKIMYANEKPIMMPQTRLHLGQLQPGDVLQLYCHLNDPTCSNVLNKILPTIMKHINTRLDIFSVGNNSKKGKNSKVTIINFAKRNNLSPSIVASHKVTLNFGDSAFDKVEAEAGKKLPLPFLLLRRGGKEMPFEPGVIS